MRELRLISALPWLFCASFLAATANAQSSDSAMAQALFDQAKRLMASGHGADACPKLEESQRLDPRSGTLINLASCYESTKRSAASWSTYLEAAAAARAEGKTEREGVARQRAAALAPRLAKLSIAVDPALQAVPGLEITRDGATVRAPEWGVPLPVDAGEHAVTAKAPGYEPFETKITVVGERASETVRVPALVALPPEPAPVVAAPPPAVPPSKPLAPPVEREKGLGTARTVALVAGGVGVIGVGLGAAFGLASKSKHDQAVKYCDGRACSDPLGVTNGNSARSDGNVSTVAMIVGGVGLAAGLTLWLAGPKLDGEARTQVGLGLGFGTVQVKGAF